MCLDCREVCRVRKADAAGGVDLRALHPAWLHKDIIVSQLHVRACACKAEQHWNWILHRMQWPGEQMSMLRH